LAGDVRYGIADRFFLGLEGGYLSATSHEKGGLRELKTRGVSAVLVGGATIDESEDVAVRALAGLGALLGTRFEEPGVGRVEGTAFLGYVGAEVEARLTGAFGITAQGLVRSALVPHPDGAPYNVDLSGGSVRAGIRTTFGGAP
jgi:hypothetical protein